MSTISEQQLKDILDKHGKWLREEEGGERANLSSADLSYADLSYANLSSANLSSANLSSADLSSANLSSADLSSADLSYANLSSANLSYADLSYADLSYANLSYANLSSANLSSANLSYADLSSADLSSANLSYANLRSANLSYANLRSIKKDFFGRLLLAKNEAAGLYDYLMKGRVDGSSYQGECACFVGTVAKIAKESHSNLSSGLKPESGSPTERFFLAISKGDTPSNNNVAKIIADWTTEFCKEHSIILPQYKIVSSLECPQAFGE